MERLIHIDKAILSVLPRCRMGCLIAQVSVSESTDQLSEMFAERVAATRTHLAAHPEKSWATVVDTRAAYKACGKEPSRYRASGELLLRRVRMGKDLPTISNVVDVINLSSMVSGFSIGGFDLSKVDGDILLTVGDNSPYLTIGGRDLNIEHMPAVRDGIGFFGTPTSDSQRTLIGPDTQNILLVYYDFNGSEHLESAMSAAASHLIQYCAGRDVEWRLVDPALGSEL